jgi:hypothetical protein
MAALAVEAEQTRQLLERIETLEQVAASLPAKDPRREQLLAVVRAELAGSAPVRPVVAADILQLTEKTVRDWAAEGVLTVHQHRPRLLLDADRLHLVSHLVADLRRAGRTRGLLDEVYRRLADDALAGRDDLAESLAEMRRGEGRVVRSATTTP